MLLPLPPLPPPSPFTGVPSHASSAAAATVQHCSAVHRHAQEAAAEAEMEADAAGPGLAATGPTLLLPDAALPTLRDGAALLDAEGATHHTASRKQGAHAFLRSLHARTHTQLARVASLQIATQVGKVRQTNSPKTPRLQHSEHVNVTVISCCLPHGCSITPRHAPEAPSGCGDGDASGEGDADSGPAPVDAEADADSEGAGERVTLGVVLGGGDADVDGDAEALGATA